MESVTEIPVDQGAANAAPSPFRMERAPDASDFGPCFVAIDVGNHFHAVQVAVATTDGKGHPIIPTKHGEMLVTRIVAAGNYFDDALKMIKSVIALEHKGDDRGPCLCHMCEFVRDRKALLAKLEEAGYGS